jgi:hypothetical protein
MITASEAATVQLSTLTDFRHTLATLLPERPSYLTLTVLACPPGF